MGWILSLRTFLSLQKEVAPASPSSVGQPPARVGACCLCGAEGAAPSAFWLLFMCVPLFYCCVVRIYLSEALVTIWH